MLGLGLDNVSGGGVCLWFKVHFDNKVRVTGGRHDWPFIVALLERKICAFDCKLRRLFTHAFGLYWQTEIESDEHRWTFDSETNATVHETVPHDAMVMCT